jgi:HK97 gp10 family phage protein
MAAKVTIHQAYERQLYEPVRNHLRTLAQEVSREAKRLVPYKTGNLRRSITYKVVGFSRDMNAVVQATAFYGIFVELGTRFRSPKPYLRPALRVVLRRHR